MAPKERAGQAAVAYGLPGLGLAANGGVVLPAPSAASSVRGDHGWGQGSTSTDTTPEAASPPTHSTVLYTESASARERALYAFLAEKERRSGSRRTVEGYSRMLWHYFGALGKPPDLATSQEVFAWAYGEEISSKEPSPVTIGARL